MLASLDHSMHFYDDIDVSDFFLYEMKAEVTGRNRGTASGRIFSRDGRLGAIVRQEGVLRIEARNGASKL
jgi:acyl-CoA thioesterase II